MSVTLTYLAGIATACAFRWLRWRHIAAVCWLVTSTPTIWAATQEDT